MSAKRGGRIIIVDDEPGSYAVKGLAAVLEEAGWAPYVVTPDPAMLKRRFIGHAYELAALEAVADAVEGGTPILDAVVLDLEFGDIPLKGLDILKQLLSSYPFLPVLVLTKHSQGAYRKIGVLESLKAGVRVEYIDKLASKEEIVLRLRRLVGKAEETFAAGEKLRIDPANKAIYARVAATWQELHGFDGHKFEVFRELAMAYVRDPAEVVSHERLLRYYYYGGVESLRVRVNEMNKVLKGYGLGAIVPKRNLGYRLVLSW